LKESKTMRMGVKAVARTGFAAALALAAAMSVAAAQNVSPQVVVPDRGDGAGGVRGCYNVQGRIYGPYRMSFCLGGGSGQFYRVRGGGLDCRGGLRWSRIGKGQIQIDLRRTSCGNGAAWSADTLVCRPVGSGGSGVSAQVVVPDDGGGSDSLRCRYIPNARGYKETTVIADRRD
jgi:hypothetical protein